MESSFRLNNIYCEDAMIALKTIPNNSIDLVLTDPPYFLDKLDNTWNSVKVANKKNIGVVTSLPSGMKFDKQQGIKFYDWYYKISLELFRILKPGGFFFSFSSPRLYHKMVSSIDDAGFEIRDGFIWLYTQNQPKAMSLNHFIEKTGWTKEEKEKIKLELNGWKTPQIKSCFEPFVMAQKPTEGTYLENFKKYKVGLINTNIKVGKGMFPSNVVSTDKINTLVDNCFLISKPDKKEKGYFNKHKTVKPLELCEYIILLTTFLENAVVLDPFTGSGTTLVAAKKNNRQFLGFEINDEYIDIARKRLSNEIKTSMRSSLVKNKSTTLF